MARAKRKTQLAKVLTGIKGLDEITGGGLPKGRPTLTWGSCVEPMLSSCCAQYEEGRRG